MNSNDGNVLFTELRASHLADVSQRRMREWAAKGIVKPSTSRAVGRRHMNFYDFSALIELIVAAKLRRRTSLQHMQEVLIRVRGRGYDNPLRELSFAVCGDEIYFQESDGTWEGGRAPGQVVLREVIPLEEIRSLIRDSVSIDRSDSRGKIEKRRGVQGSQEVFKGTRIPISAVQNYISAGFDETAILQAYPDLTNDDLAIAKKTLATA